MAVIDPKNLNRFNALLRAKQTLETRKEFFNRDIAAISDRIARVELISEHLSTLDEQASHAKLQLEQQLQTINYNPAHIHSRDAALRKAARQGWQAEQNLKSKIQAKSREISTTLKQKVFTDQIWTRLHDRLDEIQLAKNRNAQRLLDIETEIQSYYQA